MLGLSHRDAIMGASLIVSVFLAFSLSLSWFAGDKENGMLEDTIQETMAKQESINNQYQLLTVKMREKDAGQKVLEAKLKREMKRQKKLKRNLAMEKRKMRIAVESGKAVDVEAERQRIRKEVEEQASKEIAKLEAKIATIEQEKKHMEESASLGLTAKKDTDGEGWAQAEIAKARAQDAIQKYRTLKNEYENLRAARGRADEVLREQALARKKNEEELARIKTERAALEARLKAAENALRLTSMPDTNKSVKNDNTPLVAEMKKAREILRRKIDMRNLTITELERKANEFKRKARLVDDTEKQTLRSALEDKARRVAELERELENSRTREQTLRANLKNGTTTAEAAGDSVERAKIDTLRSRIQSLEAKLQETEENKRAFAEKARARINELRKRTEILDTRNMEMEKDLREGTPLRAKAVPSEKMAPPLIKQNRELQTKLLGNGLIDLQGKASNYVAQKMIDRNVELEARLQETRLQLAEAESTYRSSRSGAAYTNAIELAPGKSDTRAIIARYRKAATTITTLNQRNVELEARVGETARAIAQADAAQYIIEQLQSQNIELQKQLRAMDKARHVDEAALAVARANQQTAKAETPTEAAEPVSVEKKTLPAAPEAETVKAEEAAPAEAVTEAKAADTTVIEPAHIALAGNDMTASPEPPMVVASLEKGFDLEHAMQSIIPSVKDANVIVPVVKSPAELEAERKAKAKELREIVNEIQDLNNSLEALQEGSSPEKTTLVEIHEGVRKLRKKITRDI